MAATYARRRAVGDFGERVAARHLEAAGLEVLARNWRCGEGEIDIVARDGDTVVVVEVKTRTSARFGTPAEAVTEQKAMRLHRLARVWARSHEQGAGRIRVDVVSVLAPRRGRVTVSHLVGVA